MLIGTYYEYYHITTGHNHDSINCFIHDRKPNIYVTIEFGLVKSFSL